MRREEGTGGEVTIRTYWGSVLTDSARQKGRAGEARGGNEELRRVIFVEVARCCGLGRVYPTGQQNREQGGPSFVLEALSVQRNTPGPP